MSEWKVDGVSPNPRVFFNVISDEMCYPLCFPPALDNYFGDANRGENTAESPSEDSNSSSSNRLLSVSVSKQNISNFANNSCLLHSSNSLDHYQKCLFLTMTTKDDVT